MNAVWLLLLCALGYVVAYYTYGRFISRKIFSVDPKIEPPSKRLQDNRDYVPTRRAVIFGHHFTTIAGTGPIVGPAIGIIWGWLPALLWVFFGAIFIGAVHDFAALKISLRNHGKSISDITAAYISPRVRTLFYVIIFFSLLIVLAVFGLVIAEVFAQFPGAVIPVWLQIPIALLLGFIIYKKKGNLYFFTGMAVLLMIISIIGGAYLPFQMPALFNIPATGVWTLLLLIYCYFASILPVTVLLQPRDYINAWQLYIALGILILGIVITGLTSGLPMAAPALNLNPEGAPPLWPFMFIIIACGAVSGFHSLAASGTTAKQLKCESDIQFVGYGAMLIESLLAVIIIIAVAAGLGLGYQTQGGELLYGFKAWHANYSSWMTVSGMGSKLTAVVIGCANILKTFKIPFNICLVMIGVFIASFAGTTMDSTCRIQRYIISELFQKTRFSFLAGKWTATGIAVITAAMLAFSGGADGKGALALWPLFGSVNQLLASLALIVATVYLKEKGGLKYLTTALPLLVMATATFWGAWYNQRVYLKNHQWLLSSVNAFIFLIALFIIIESLYVIVIKSKKKTKE